MLSVHEVVLHSREFVLRNFSGYPIPFSPAIVNHPYHLLGSCECGYGPVI